MNEPYPDPHFGTDEQMLAWAEKEGLEPVKGANGDYDWQATWDAYMARD